MWVMGSEIKYLKVSASSKAGTLTNLHKQGQRRMSHTVWLLNSASAECFYIMQSDTLTYKMGCQEESHTNKPFFHCSRKNMMGKHITASPSQTSFYWVTRINRPTLLCGLLSAVDATDGQSSPTDWGPSCSNKYFNRAPTHFSHYTLFFTVSFLWILRYGSAFNDTPIVAGKFWASTKPCLCMANLHNPKTSIF